MERRLAEIDPAEELVERIVQFRAEQRELGIEDPILPEELQAAYEGLTEAVRLKLAERNLRPLSRTKGETHIRPLRILEARTQ